MTTHYEVLGVTAAASAAEVTKAYRAAALECHPDRDPTADPSKMARVNEAYAVLGDPTTRAAYDEQCAAPADLALQQLMSDVLDDPHIKWPAEAMRSVTHQRLLQVREALLRVVKEISRVHKLRGALEDPAWHRMSDERLVALELRRAALRADIQVLEEVQMRVSGLEDIVN